MKRPIYLDERERELARRVFKTMADRLNARAEKELTDRTDRMAVRWTRDEILHLAAKFNEPAKPEK